jgi:hypothetical protein
MFLFGFDATGEALGDRGNMGKFGKNLLRRVGDCATGDALGDFGILRVGLVATGEALGDLGNIGKNGNRRLVGAATGSSTGAGATGTGATGTGTGATGTGTGTGTEATGVSTGVATGASTGAWALTIAKMAKKTITIGRDSILIFGFASVVAGFML